MSQSGNSVVHAGTTFERAKADCDSAAAPRDGKPRSIALSRRTVARLPDFVIIGAARCSNDVPGTPTCASTRRSSRLRGGRLLRSATCRPTRFRRSRHRVRAKTRASTRPFFATRATRAVGEASPTYLFYPRSAERLRQAIPDAKLICVLRDPVERVLALRSGAQDGLRDRDRLRGCGRARGRALADRPQHALHVRARASTTASRVLARFPRERIPRPALRGTCRPTPQARCAAFTRSSASIRTSSRTWPFATNRSMLPKSGLVRGRSDACSACAASCSATCRRDSSRSSATSSCGRRRASREGRARAHVSCRASSTTCAGSRRFSTSTSRRGDPVECRVRVCSCSVCATAQAAEGSACRRAEGSGSVEGDSNVRYAVNAPSVISEVIDGETIV